MLLRSLLAATALTWATPAIGETETMPIVVLQGLNKITARISTFEAPVGETVGFGSLVIVTRVCHKTPPEEPPENTVFLEIAEQRPDEAAVPLFSGWMFSSAPAISALEHPVYDVWVKDCRKDPNSSDESSEGN